MELMSISLDKFYKFVHDHLAGSIPEDILGKITVAVITSVFIIIVYYLIQYTVFCEIPKHVRHSASWG